MEKTDQILKNGHLCFDNDQKLTKKEMDALFQSLFKNDLAKDGKQYVAFNKVGILTANITYLGNPHPLYKKRIQLKNYFLDYYHKNLGTGIKTIYVGVYTYNESQLFVVFDPKTYVTKKSHNSSAHIFSTNLQYAQKVGEFLKTDSFGNSIHVFKKSLFIEYVQKLAKLENDVLDYDYVVDLVKTNLKDFIIELPRVWNGLDAYKEMAKANYKMARQNRWPGWYFEFLLQNFILEHHIADIAWNADKKKGGIDLDLIFPSKPWTYGDVKADQEEEDILGNKFQCFDEIINEHGGTVYYICLLYKADKDSAHDYAVTRYWNTLRDEDKAYTDLESIRNGGKNMKYSVTLQSLNVLKIDRNAYEIVKENPFYQGRNSNGKAREPKLKIKKDLIESLSIYSVNFGEEYGKI